MNTQKAPRGDERGAEKAEGQAKRIQRIAGITDADPPAVPTAASEMPWDRTGMPATASAAVQPRLKPAPATRDGEPPKGTRERNPSKENGSEEKDGNGDPRLHDCLPAKWMNHVLVHETSTVKEVLAVVWAQVGPLPAPFLCCPAPSLLSGRPIR